MSDARPTDTPLTDALAASMPDETRSAVAAWDAARLEAELERTPALRGKVSAPVHSVRNLLGAWERFVRLMAAGWPPEGWYSLSAYRELLDERDLLDTALSELPSAAAAALTPLLEQLDAVYFAHTEPDPEETLRPWLGAPASTAPTDRRSRRPRHAPSW
ncbi:hypothetical protein [Streptacidiphilus neutrinimicus]|uniref:hypothetical protein n=1 Tax=Streptacidiphilus neutrinimicus TaxID=105420 RepID=UPI0005A89250|nr:hypothetical protein [Streptacidiphilus neutrinimicus]